MYKRIYDIIDIKYIHNGKSFHRRTTKNRIFILNAQSPFSTRPTQPIGDRRPQKY